MNTHFMAKLHSNEIWDTLFFTGVEFNRVKVKNDPSMQYIFITPNFDCVISGNRIKVGEKVFKSITPAKQYIWSLV